jgi:hypothetical protein
MSGSGEATDETLASAGRLGRGSALSRVDFERHEVTLYVVAAEPRVLALKYGPEERLLLLRTPNVLAARSWATDLVSCTVLSQGEHLLLGAHCLSRIEWLNAGGADMEEREGEGEGEGGGEGRRPLPKGGADAQPPASQASSPGAPSAAMSRPEAAEAAMAASRATLGVAAGAVGLLDLMAG